MRIRDIIAHAAVNSGVISSFNINPNDGSIQLDADVEAMGLTFLKNELIPQCNTDRTLDMKIATGEFPVIENKIVLSTLPFTGADNRPNDFYPTSYNAHIEWAPARVDRVMTAEARIPYDYLNMTDYFTIDYRWNPFTYTFEVGETLNDRYTEGGHQYMIIHIRNNNSPLRLVYPVPIYIKNDVLVAQPKFNQYIIDILSAKLALCYGMQTLPMMMQAADVSYSKLLKQQVEPMTDVDVRQKMRNLVNHGRSRWRFDGFV